MNVHNRCICILVHVHSIGILHILFVTNFDFQKGDILLSINGTSLLGLSHAEAVSQVKVNTEPKVVTLKVIEAPETSTGPGNFVPTWLFWQNLPRYDVDTCSLNF